MNELIPPQKPLPDKEPARIIRQAEPWHYQDRDPSPIRWILFVLGLAAAIVVVGLFVVNALAESLR